jgi:hypothetical protein
MTAAESLFARLEFQLALYQQVESLFASLEFQLAHLLTFLCGHDAEAGRNH